MEKEKRKRGRRKSAFGAFVMKELFHILRDKRTMLILLGIPIVQILLFGFAISTEIRNAKVGVLDPSKDEMSRHIVERVSASPYFTITHELSSPEEADQRFREGKIDLAIIFPPKFETELNHSNAASLQLIADASDPNNAGMIMNYVSGTVNNAMREKLAESGLQPQKQISSEVHMLFNPRMHAAYNFVPGVMGLVLMLICAMMTSFSVVREKERGTMEVLLVSPIKPFMVVVAKIIPYLLLSCVNLTTILLLSVFVLDVPIAGSLLSLIALSLLFILVNLGLGMLISTVVDTQVAAMMLAGMGLMMPTMLLSGMVFPIESMPTLLQYLSTVIPARWYISAVKKIMIEGASIVYTLQEIGVMTLMLSVLVMVTVRKFKKRLE